MFLQLLERKGVNIKDLAAKRIALRTHETEASAFMKIVEERKEGEGYSFVSLEPLYSGVGEVENYFTDVDYVFGGNSEKEYIHEVDRAWVKIVYSALLKAEPKEALNYKNRFLVALNKSLSTNKLDRVFEVTDMKSEFKMSSKEREKEYKMLEAKEKIIKKDFERVFETAEEEEKSL